MSYLKRNLYRVQSRGVVIGFAEVAVQPGPWFLRGDKNPSVTYEDNSVKNI